MPDQATAWASTIAGGIAEAFWGGLPAAIVREVRLRLPPEFVEVIDAFDAVYPLRARGHAGVS